MTGDTAIPVRGWKIINAIRNKPGTSVWLVGGAVRDLLRGKEIRDIDLATNAKPIDIWELVRSLGIKPIPDNNAFKHGVVKVALSDGSVIDISTIRKDVETDGRHAKVLYTDDIKQDLERRDFTVNAMAIELLGYEIDTDKIIDPFGGTKDIQDKRLRFVGDPARRIQEDFLRMLRFCRFSALGYEWELDPDALIECNRFAQAIHKVSAERVRDEIFKGLSYPCPARLFTTMSSAGLLQEVFPEMARGIGVEQNEYHAEEVFDHLMYAVNASAKLTDKPLLRLAAATHDIGKARTKSTGKDGRVHFYKHEVVGTTIMYEWMRKYKFSNTDVEYVTKLVRHHQFRFDEETKDKTIKKWLRVVGPVIWKDLLTLRAADRMGNMAKKGKPAVTTHMIKLEAQIRSILKSGEPIFDKDLEMNGRILIALGFKPGPIFKDIFQECWSLVLKEPGKNTMKDLTDFVLKHWRAPNGERVHA